MSGAIKFKISSTVAAFVRPGVTVEKKLSGIQTAPLLEPFERVTLLFCLLKDAEPDVKEAAATEFSALPGEDALSYILAPEAHPSLLHELARVHCGNPEVMNALLGTELLSIRTREFLHSHQESSHVLSGSSPAQECGEECIDENRSDEVDSPDGGLPEATGDMQDEEAAVIDEEDEQFLSKYKIAMSMGIGEKIKMAL